METNRQNYLPVEDTLPVQSRFHWRAGTRKYLSGFVGIKESYLLTEAMGQI